jgi:hypothetical protein
MHAVQHLPGWHTLKEQGKAYTRCSNNPRSGSVMFKARSSFFCCQHVSPQGDLLGEWTLSRVRVLHAVLLTQHAAGSTCHWRSLSISKMHAAEEARHAIK